MSPSIATAQVLIGFALLGLLWTGPVARLLRDNLRNRIRRIRNQLFDLMAEREYDFNGSAYRAVRQELNGIIRLSNRLSPLVFLAALLTWRVDEGIDPAASEIDK